LQVDELVRLGFAKIGNRGDHKFSNEWDTDQLDDWLCNTLPTPFKQLELLNPDVHEHNYLWRLLKASRSCLELHRESPDGYDMISAKGSKSKGWQDSKLFFGMWIALSTTN
jgi:hypothetical protein